MRQTAIWIDHNEARVFHVEGSTFDEKTVHAPTHHLHRHPKSDETKTRNHPQDETRFFGEIMSALEGRDEILLLGPSVTKLHFLHRAQKHAPAIAERIVGIETSDHPTDRQIVAHVRHYFQNDPPRLGVTS
jgi:stalled ribosome rescue protein Dom34